MKTMRKAAIAAVVGAMGLAGVSGQAMGGVSFTNQAMFVSNLTPGFSLTNFSSFSAFSTPTSPLALGSGGFTYQATTTAQAFFIDSLSGNNFLSTATATDGFSRPITLNFTGSAPVFAVGGNIFVVSAFGALVTDPPFNQVKLTFSDGTMTTLTAQTNSSFFGYISNTPLTSVTIDPLATQRFVGIDNLYVGTSPLPTPGAAGLAALGGLACVRRRRRGCSR